MLGGQQPGQRAEQRAVGPRELLDPAMPPSELIASHHPPDRRLADTVVSRCTESSTDGAEWLAQVVALAAQSVDLLPWWPEHVDAGVPRMGADSGGRRA
jgi:hypothetical protein